MAGPGTGAGAWADSKEARAAAEAAHNPERFMELPAKWTKTGGYDFSRCQFPAGWIWEPQRSAVDVTAARQQNGVPESSPAAWRPQFRIPAQTNDAHACDQGL